MRIIFNEIRKIFGVRTIILLIIICAIICKLFITFDIKYFPNGIGERATYKICAQMLKDYGNSMDEKEFQNFKELYNKQVKEAEELLQSRPDAVKAGVTTYEAFKNSAGKYDDAGKLVSKMVFEESRDIFWELQYRENIIGYYERIGSGINPIKSEDRILERKDEIIKNGSIRSVFPSMVYHNYNNLMNGLAILVALSIMFAISPIFIKDRNNKINYIQYTTKTGRKIFKTKLLAALISSSIIMIIYFTGFFILYSQNKTGIFLNSSLNSFANVILFWFDMTFMQYIALTISGIFIIGIVMTLIGAYVSRIAPNYITLVGIQVPVSFLIMKLCSEILVQDFSIARYPKFLMPAVYIILISVAIALIVHRMKREKVVDIVC